MSKKKWDLLSYEGTIDIAYQNQKDNYIEQSNEHYHPFYEIYYQLSGEKLYFFDDEQHLVKEGEVVLVNKNLSHSTMSVVGQPSERVLINFKNNPVLNLGEFDFISLFLSDNKVIEAGDEREQIEKIIFNMLREKEQKKQLYELYQNSLLSQLLIILKRMFNARATNEKNSSKRKNSINKVVRYVDENFVEDITLQYLCEKFFLNKSYISRGFHKTTGQTLCDYINHVRIKKACSLILDTDDNITDIASAVGYNNSSHFGRVFKSIIGDTPLNYRRRRYFSKR